MRDCKSVLKDLFDYIDKEMNDQDASEMKAHLELCRVCFDRMEFEQLLRSHLQDKTTHPCPDSLKTRIKKLIENY